MKIRQTIEPKSPEAFTYSKQKKTNNKKYQGEREREKANTLQTQREEAGLVCCVSENSKDLIEN